jgi:hypothetical protein
MTKKYRKGSERVQWGPVLNRAAEIVNGYATGVTLRQLFYRLVAEQRLPNLQSYYNRLSDRTAATRREGTFPDLLDRVTRIERYAFFEDPDDALDYLREVYRKDRTEGQEWTVYLGVEKAGISAQLDAWFSDPLGIPHVALGGYASQTIADKVRRDIQAQGRPAALIYAGDHDPSGEDIDRDFERRVGAFDKVVRVALNAEQIAEYDLPENPDPEVAAKLARDSRAATFERRHGSLHQYEVDALPPDTLRDLYRSAIDGLWDDDALDAVLERERADLEELGQ